MSAYIETNLLSRHRIMEKEEGPGVKVSSYKIVAHSARPIKKIEEYLEKYPLKSSKYLDYKDWKKCGEIIEKTPENYKKIQDTKNEMNSKRTYFN